MRRQNVDALTSHGNIEGRKVVTALLDAGLDALDPYLRVKELIEVKEDRIVLHTDGFEMKEDPRSGPAEYLFRDYVCASVCMRVHASMCVRVCV